jgi:hypothetical protein
MDDVSIIQTLSLPLQPCHSASLPLKHPFRVCYQRSKLISILRASLAVLLELVRFATPAISALSRRIRYRKPKKSSFAWLLIRAPRSSPKCPYVGKALGASHRVTGPLGIHGGGNQSAQRQGGLLSDKG